MDHADFQWKIRKYQIQDKSGTALNPGHVPEIEDCGVNSRTDGHLYVNPKASDLSGDYVVVQASVVELFVD